MVEYGQYPLVLQLENGIPVGLAESVGNFSSVNLVVSSISATDYLGLTGTGSITIPLPLNQGGTAATTNTAARANLGLIIGTDVQPNDPGLTDIAGLSPGDSTFIVGDGTNWVSESGPTVRTSLGLGSIATLNSPIPITDGGTGATTDSAARANLGLTIGTHVQAQSANLNQLASISLTDKKILVGGPTNTLVQIDVPTNNTFLKYTTAGGFSWDAGGSVSLPGTQNSILYENPVGTIASNNTIKVLNGVLSASSASSTTASANTYYVGPPGSDVPITKSGAGDIAVAGNTVYRVGGTDISVADGGTGASTESQARINLGLSALATASSVNLSTQVTNTLPITNGGTGQTTANAAVNALLPSQSTHNGKYLKTDGANTSWDTPAGGGSWTSVFRTTDQTITGITETSDNTLTFSIGASENYSFRTYINFDENGGGYSLSVSSGATADWNLEFFDNSNRSYTLNAGQTAGGAFIASETIMADLAGPSKGAIKINGLLSNGGTATGLLIKFASNNAIRTATNKAGSYLEYKKL